MDIICSKCNGKLTELGAILLSPPSGDLVFKFHICKQCYNKFLDLINKE